MAKNKDIQTRRNKKLELWVSRTEKWSGLSGEKVAKLLLTKRTQSLRVNPLKSTDSGIDTLNNLGCLELPVSWCPNGYFGSAHGIDDLIDSGEVYIQNASSWLPVIALDPRPNDLILDVCAAPGGKSSHIQAITKNQSRLICNDNSKPRLMKLKANLQRLGADAEYSLTDATRISRKLDSESFDKILIDAPCSGEGMMTLNPEDIKLFDSWSVAHIRRLSDLQKKILSESWRLLRPGGTIVYSTCTMAPEENEAVIDYLLRKDASAELLPIDIDIDCKVEAVKSWNDRRYKNDLSNCIRLLPGKYTEAFFVAKITKKSIQ